MASRPSGALSLPRPRFDGVCHVGGINFFSNPKAAVKEMIRVVKAGTKVVIVDKTYPGATVGCFAHRDIRAIFAKPSSLLTRFEER